MSPLGLPDCRFPDVIKQWGHRFPEEMTLGADPHGPEHLPDQKAERFMNLPADRGKEAHHWLMLDIDEVVSDEAAGRDASVNEVQDVVGSLQERPQVIPFRAQTIPRIVAIASACRIDSSAISTPIVRAESFLAPGRRPLVRIFQEYIASWRAEVAANRATHACCSMPINRRVLPD